MAGEKKRLRTSARASSRVTTNAPVADSRPKRRAAEEVKFVADAEELDIELEEEGDTDSAESEQESLDDDSDLLMSDEEEAAVSQSSTETAASELSEDEAEIQRIIAHTEAETRNMPLTARQRHALQPTNDVTAATEEFFELPMSKPLTEEQMLRRSEKSRRRKMQRDIKLEEAKRATIDRLLTKQKGNDNTSPPVDATDSTDSGNVIEANHRHQDTPDETVRLPSGHVRYVDQRDVTLLLFSDQQTLQQAFSPPPRPPTTTRHICAVKGCNAERKYTHPRLNVPFCSSSCYKTIEKQHD